MSIEVKNLVKYYGDFKALDSVTFQAEKGAILGFLGPNGAGKSTTMKILSGYLSSSSGTVLVAGYDIITQSLQARRATGYLAENNPLYPELYVAEFLQFVADLCRVRKPRLAVSEVLSQTGLEGVKGKKIKDLSRGYRQRVGLCQALIAKPSVLILDEPTSGLDPNQLVDIRALIRRLGETITIILSTHIMQEVEALCQQVVILNLGKIVANDSVQNLLRTHSSVEVYWVEFSPGISLQAVQDLDYGMKVEALPTATAGSTRYSVTTNSGARIQQDLFDLAVRQKSVMVELQKKESDLSHIFQQLTKS